jgi:hypothetical protein
MPGLVMPCQTFSSRLATLATFHVLTEHSRHPLSQLVLTFVTDPEQVAAEMVRITRPGGVVAAAAWEYCRGLVYQPMLWDTAAALDPQAGRIRDRLFSNPLSTPDGLKELWQTAGLTTIEAGSLTIRMNYANFADYGEPLLGRQGPVGDF